MAQQKKLQGQQKKKRMGFDLGLAATLILLIFRIPLANVIEDKGNGYLAVSWEVFVLFSLVFSYGFSRAVGSLVKERLRKGQFRNSNRVIKTALVAGTITSVIGASLMYLLSKSFVTIFMDSQLTDISVYMKLSGISVQLYAIVMVIGTIFGIFRGYFEGIGTKVPTQMSRVVEAVITMTGAFIFCSMLKEYGTKVGTLLFNEQYKLAFGAAGVVAGCICGSMLSGLFLTVLYMLYHTNFKKLLQKDIGSIPEKYTSILKALYESVFLVSAEVLFFLLYRTVNLSLYIKTYVQGENPLRGIEYAGVYYGKITVLVAISIVCILALVERNRKKVSYYFLKEQNRNGRYRLTNDLEKICSIGLPVVGSFLVLTEFLMKTFFQSCTKTDAFMMRISSVSIVFMTLGVYLYRILVDLDLRKYVWIIQSIAFVAQTAVMIFWITISVTGDISMPFSELVFWVIVACGELMAITKLYKMRFAWNKIVLNPIIRTTILVLAEFLVVQLLQKHLDAWLVCILALGVGIGCYELSKKLPFLKKGTKME